MTEGITHNKIATLPDQPGVEINKAEWNHTHDVTALHLDEYLSIGTLVGGQTAHPQLTLIASETQDQDPFTNIMEVYDATGTLVAAFDFGGTFDTAAGFHISSPVGSSGGIAMGSDGGYIAVASLAHAFRYQTGSGGNYFNINAAGGPAAVATIGAPTENQPLLELDSFGGAADAIFYYGPPDFVGEFRVLAGGAIVTGQYSVPADGDLVANQVAMWFDSTNGASKVMFKGKSANGTVVAGSVALT